MAPDDFGMGRLARAIDRLGDEAERALARVRAEKRRQSQLLTPSSAPTGDLLRPVEGPGKPTEAQELMRATDEPG